MSDIETKIKDATHDICEMIEVITDCITSELEKGVHSVDTEEMGAVADILKDLAETKYRIVRSMYFEQIMKEMEGSEYGVDYDENGKMYYTDHSTHTRPLLRTRKMEGWPPKMYYQDMDMTENSENYADWIADHISAVSDKIEKSGDEMSQTEREMVKQKLRLLEQKLS